MRPRLASRNHRPFAAVVAVVVSGIFANGTCVILTSTQVNLSWTVTPSAAATDYQIFRSTSNGGPYTSIATVSNRTTTSYTDTTVTFSTTYYYVLEAARNLWRSNQSNQASITTPTLVCI